VQLVMTVQPGSMCYVICFAALTWHIYIWNCWYARSLSSRTEKVVLPKLCVSPETRKVVRKVKALKILFG
jgi:hypothetical protein